MWGLICSMLSLLTSTSTAAPGQEEAVLLFVGDAMQHQAQFDKAKEIGKAKGVYDYSECFSMLAPELNNVDYAVVNLELPLGGGPTYTGFPCFSAPDSYAIALQNTGFDMMLTSNNHCLDRKDRGARRTLDVLDSLKVDHVGTFRNVEERNKLVPFIKDINGFKIAFLNYTYGTNGLKATDGAEVAYIDKQKMKDEINLAREKGAEIVIVAIHWGIEYVLLENNVQRDLANYLVDCGVDMIIGGHPHVIQPMKVVHNEKEDKDVLVVYSLGNFISNMKTADTRGGAMVWTTLKRDSLGNARFGNAEYELLFAAKPEGKRNFRVIPGWMEDSIPSSQKAHWDIFKRGAIKVFDAHNVSVPRRNRK